MRKAYSSDGGRLPGSLTVFLALLLGLFLAATGVFLDFARAQVVSFQLQSAVTAAAESVFAGYHAPLFGRYQLLGRQLPPGGTAALQAETGKYIDAWGGGTGSGFHARLASFRTQEVLWKEPVFLTDEWGAVFREMATQTMRASAVEILGSFWQEHLQLSDAGVQEVLAQYGSTDSLKADTVFPDYDSMKEAIGKAEEEAALAKKAREEEEQRQAEAELAALEAGEEPPTASGPSREELEAEQQKEKEKRAGKKFLDVLGTIRRILRHGLLSVELPDGKSISSGRIPGGGLPSSLSAAEKGRHMRRDGGSGNPLLFREYLMRNMDCFTSAADKTPLYELEYLIVGKKSDRKNLEGTASRLTAIRLGLNMAFLETSADKQGIAHSAAALAVGWTGQAALVEITAQLLLSAWAAAESLADVRILLDGGRVPLVKTETDWKLSLENAASGWETVRGADNRDQEEGLSYEDYLRICLYLTSLETLSYRGMDVIQWNIRRIDPDFRMNACLTEGNLQASARGNVLFLPLYYSVLKQRRGSFLLEKKGGYSYLKEPG